MTHRQEPQRRLLDAYTDAQRAAFDRAVERLDPTAFTDEAALARHLDDVRTEAEHAWMHTPTPAADGRTPADWVRDLETPEDRTAFLDLALSTLDAPLPTAWAHALRPSAPELLDTLNRWIDTGLAAPWTDDQAMDPAMIRAVRATELLGTWEIDLETSGLLTRYLDHPAPPAPWSEAVAAALAGRGPADTDRLLDVLTDRLARTDGARTVQDDYLLQALTAIGRDRPDERIYQCLRTAFRTTRPRQHPVILLADYGDPRAVTMLRRFIIETADTVDETTYVEVIRAIRQLGGRTDDLPNLYAAGRSTAFE